MSEEKEIEKKEEEVKEEKMSEELEEEEEQKPFPMDALPEASQRAISAAMAAKYLQKALSEGEVSLPEAIILTSWLERQNSPNIDKTLALLRGKEEKLSLAEMMLLDSWLERKEERKLRANMLTPDQIKSLIEEVIEKKLSKPSETQFLESKFRELASEISGLREELNTIKKRFEQEEKQKEQMELINKFQEPLLNKIKEAEKRQSELEKRLEEISNKEVFTTTQAQSLTEDVSKLRKTLTEIKETAKLMGLKEPESIEKPPQSSYQNIPVSGSIPAWAVAIPQIINQIFENIEKRAETWLKSSTGESLIQLPQKPKREIPKIGEGKLLRIPPQKPETKPKPAEAEAPIKTVELKPVKVQIREIEKPAQPKTEPKQEKPAKKQEKKIYRCKECGETFDKPWKLASHVAKYHRKKKKKEESEPQRQAKNKSTTPTQS